jgi:hypothetical protein
LLSLLAAGACTRTITAPSGPVVVPIPAAPSAAPAASSVAGAAASASAAPKAPPPPSAPLGAWTDPGALAELARSCDFAPVDPSPEEPSALSCQVHFEQTCNPIDCDIDFQDRCLPACKATCEGCAAGCRKTCSACAAPCTGKDCRAACAETTGNCLQECLQAEDHCSTGTCSQALDDCSRDHQAAFEKSKCERLRPKFSACVDRCLEHPPREITDAESNSFLRGMACQDRCVTSVLGNACGQFRANFRIF